MTLPALSVLAKVAAMIAVGTLLTAGLVLITSCRRSSFPAQTKPETPTAVAESTPPAETDEFSGPREDCPSGWNSYGDSAGYFSFCYPGDLRAVVGEGVPGGSMAVTIHAGADPTARAPRPNSIVFTIYWKPWSSRNLVADRCESDQRSFGVPTRSEAKVTASREMIACIGGGSTVVHGIEPVSIEFPDKVDQGFIQIFAFQTGPEIEFTTRLIDEILNSVRVRGEQ